MAKKQRKMSDEDAGLPFFKFFIQKWLLGNIQFCSIEAQGLFVNICVLYWGKRCELTSEQIQKSYPKKYLKFIKELESQEVLKISDGKISISFLDEQLKDCQEVSELNSRNALEGWKQRKSNATALPPHSERIANAMPQEEDKDKDEEEDKDKIPSEGLLRNFEVIEDSKPKEPIILKAKLPEAGGANFEDYEEWAGDVITGKDYKFTEMLMKEPFKVNGALAEYAKSFLGLLAQYPNKKPPDQHRFRVALIGHISENIKKIGNGQRNNSKGTLGQNDPENGKDYKSAGGF